MFYVRFYPSLGDNADMQKSPKVSHFKASLPQSGPPRAGVSPPWVLVSPHFQSLPRGADFSFGVCSVVT